MSNTANKKMIIERLKLDCDTEMIHHELNNLLEEELQKPSEEIDSQLVQELLDLLGEAKPTEEETRACWNKIQKELDASKPHPWRTVLRSCAAAAAVVFMLVLTYQGAQAFNWTHLLKWLTPLAETFGIYSENSEEVSSLVSETDYSDEEADFSQIMYQQLEDMPTHHKGFPIVPSWVPEGFAFVQGSLYEDPDMANVAITYKNQDRFISMTVKFLANETDVSSYQFERTADETVEKLVGNHLVTFYFNTDQMRPSASWIDQNVHYFINGDLTEAEIVQIICSIP